MRSSIIFTPHQILLGSSSQGEWEERDIWRAWGDVKLIKKLYEKREGKRHQSADLGINIRTRCQRYWVLGEDWIILVQDCDQWRPLVYTVMDVLIPWKPLYFLTCWVLLACEEGLIHHSFRCRFPTGTQGPFRGFCDHRYT
jgi:hypothetical protein